jgi:hypothetical protein
LAILALPSWQRFFVVQEEPLDYRQTAERAALLETTAPSRTPDVRADALVAAVNAVVGGLLLGTLIAAVIWTAGKTNAWPLRWWVVASTGAASIIWLSTVTWSRSTIWSYEKRTGADIDGARAVGEPDIRLLPINPRLGQENAARAAEREYRQKYAQFIHTLVATPTRPTSAIGPST